MARIIILDDNKTGSAFLKMILARYRYCVSRTVNIQEAIHPPSHAAPHLVLINYAFGNHRGWEVFNYLKRIAGHIPALVYVLEQVNGANADWIVKAVQAVLGEVKHRGAAAWPRRFEPPRIQGVAG